MTEAIKARHPADRAFGLSYLTEKSVEGKYPQYHFWNGLLNTKGVLTQKTGAIIDWSNKDWEKRFKPE